MKAYAVSRTQAGIDRRARERGLMPAIIEPPKEEIARARPAMASNVVRFRKRREYEPSRVPSTYEVSHARHMAFLSGLRTEKRSMRSLIDLVAAWHRVSVADIMSRARYRHIVKARFDAIRAVKEANPNLSYPQLGRIFDGRDHTSILAALRKRGLV